MITIPTISELYTQIKTDLESSYGSQIPAFGKNVLRVIASTQAAKIWLLYKGLGLLQKNIWVDTADPEARGGTLERFGRVRLNRNPFTATAAQYVCSVTGTVGATISAKTTFKSDDDSVNPGKLFILDQEFTLGSSPDNITLRALEPGIDSRLDVDDGLTATIPIANVDKGVSIVSEFVAPVAAEDIEDYRTRIIEAFQLEPQGGAGSDYRIWAGDAQGVAKVYPYVAYGGGNEVDVYVEANEDDSSDGKGTPTAQMLTDVFDVINFDPDDTKELNERGRRPLNAIVNVLAVTIREVDIVIADFENLDSDTQTTIESALEELISEIRPFVASCDVLVDRNDRLDNNRIVSKIYEAVPGAIFGAVTLKVDNVTLSSYTFENGDIPNLRTVTFS